MKATIYSIAKELGVSASTVSRAFSRPDLVNSAVREKILATARSQGYELNRAARSLTTGRTGMIGVVVVDITNPFFPPLIRAIDRAATEADASILLLDAETGGADAVEQLSRLSAQVDGLIVASPRIPAEQLRKVVGATPTVLVNRSVTGLPSVVCDNTAALHQAADHLVELGHRRIALMKGPAGSWAADRRAAAIRRWIKTAPEGVELIELGPFDAAYETGRSAAPAVAATGATAIFAFDDFLACGIIGGLADLGVSVPQDRSVIGCDDVLLARTLTPQLTTVTAPFDDLGRRAVAMLTEVVAGRTPKNETVSGVFAPRGTSAAATS